MDDFIPAQQIPGLKPWLCSYDGPDGRHSITLYGDTAEAVLENNCGELSGLTVDGEMVGEIPVDPDGGDEIARRMNRK